METFEMQQTSKLELGSGLYNNMAWSFLNKNGKQQKTLRWEKTWETPNQPSLGCQQKI